MKLTARIAPEISALLSDSDLLFQAALLHPGPTHLLFPQMMSRNLKLFTEVADREGVNLNVLFAHKPTKSPALVREAEHLGIGIDVASIKELSSALSSGFDGKRIEVSGHKTDELLLIALKHGCLISLDSISELQRLISLLKGHASISSARVLIRVERPDTRERKLSPKDSKFGIASNDLPVAFQLLHTNRQITLEGFHHHSEEQDPDYRAAQAQGLAELLKDSYALGFEPTKINVGGGFRQPQLQDPQQWQRFIENIEEGLTKKLPLKTWRQHSYGMALARDGSIQNHAPALNRYPTVDVAMVLKAILNAPSPDGHRLARFVTENGFDLTIEPGSALLDNCGISLVEVIEIKHTQNNTPLIIGNTHALNISQRGKEIGTDPILISRQVPHGSPVEACIAGNLCRETDMLSTRAIEFSSLPQPGDLLCFINTAAYFSDFEEATPHQHPMGKKFVVITQSGKTRLCDEQRYFPDLEK